MCRPARCAVALETRTKKLPLRRRGLGVNSGLCEARAYTHRVTGAPVEGEQALAPIERRDCRHIGVGERQPQ